LAGYAEPRLVLMSSASEVSLPLPLPHTASSTDQDVARDLARALASVGLEGRTHPGPTSDETAPPAPSATPIALLLAADGLHVERDGHALAPGCTEQAAAPAVTIPTRELAPSQLNACLDAAGDASMLAFRTSPETRYADAIAILEILAARGPVGLAVAR
jgi:hypothetical protein